MLNRVTSVTSFTYKIVKIVLTSVQHEYVYSLNHAHLSNPRLDDRPVACLALWYVPKNKKEVQRNERMQTNFELIVIVFAVNFTYFSALQNERYFYN